MNRTTFFTLCATALTLGLVAPDTEARPGGRPQGPPPPLAHVVERHADELGLDAATLDEIRALDEQARETNGEQRESIREAREQLRSLMEAPESDEAAVIAQVEALGALETQARVARVRTDLQVRSLLTPEQLVTLQDLRPERPQGGERSRSGRGGQQQDGERPQRGFQRSR